MHRPYTPLYAWFALNFLLRFSKLSFLDLQILSRLAAPIRE